MRWFSFARIAQEKPLDAKCYSVIAVMPLTAERLGVGDRCNIGENVSGGVRYLAWLMRKFQGDPRLVAAAYLAGEEVIARRGLAYRNR